MSAYYSFPLELFEDSQNNLKVLTAPTPTTSTTTSPRNGLVSLSFRSSVYLQVRSSAFADKSFLTMIIAVVLHIFQALRFRLWWLFPSAILCGLLEVTGWSGRVWSSRNPYLEKPFLLQ
jgi:hypothetical protein